EVEMRCNVYAINGPIVAGFDRASEIGGGVAERAVHELSEPMAENERPPVPAPRIGVLAVRFQMSLVTRLESGRLAGLRLYHDDPSQCAVLCVSRRCMRKERQHQQTRGDV